MRCLGGHLVARDAGKALAEVMGREEFVGMRMNFLERVRWHALILLMGLESISQPRVKPAE